MVKFLFPLLSIFSIVMVTFRFAEALVKPSNSQAKLLDYEIGAIIHFNMETFVDKFKTDQVPGPNKFNPSQFSTDQWIEAAKSFGAKFAVLTLDYWSGFLLWPSKTYNYSVKHTKWMRGQGDIVAQFVQSCERNNLEYGFYYSAQNNWFVDTSNYFLKTHKKQQKNPKKTKMSYKKHKRNHEKQKTKRKKQKKKHKNQKKSHKHHKRNHKKQENCFKKQKKFNRIVKKHLLEILGLNSTYKKPFLFWLEASVILQTSEKIGLLVKNLTRNTVCLKCSVFTGKEGGARLVGNERGKMTLPNWYAVSGKTYQEYERGNPFGTEFRPAVCTTYLRNHLWFWKPHTDNDREQTRQLIQKYLTSVGRGCPLILNIAPDRRGLVPEGDLWSYKKLGEAIQMLYSEPILQVGRPKLIVGKYKTWHLLHPLKVRNGSVVLMENVKRYGQLVKSYEIMYLMESSEENRIENGTTVGHKRIHPFSWKPLDEIEKDEELPSVVGISVKITKLLTNASSIYLRKISMFDWSNAVHHGLL